MVAHFILLNLLAHSYVGNLTFNKMALCPLPFYLCHQQETPWQITLCGEPGARGGGSVLCVLSGRLYNLLRRCQIAYYIPTHQRPCTDFLIAFYLHKCVMLESPDPFLQMAGCARLVVQNCTRHCNWCNECIRISIYVFTVHVPAELHYCEEGSR